MLVYLLFAYYVYRWNRGVLPVSMALAVILIIFAAVAGPAWFERDKEGFSSPPLPEPLLGILTLALIPVSVLLIFFCCAASSRAGTSRRAAAPTSRPAGSSASPASRTHARLPESHRVSADALVAEAVEAHGGVAYDAASQISAHVRCGGWAFPCASSAAP